MYPGDTIIENLFKNGVQASVIDLGRDEDFNQYMKDHPEQDLYLLPDDITEDGWKKFAALLPKNVVVGLRGSQVPIEPQDGKNPVVHLLHIAESH